MKNEPAGDRRARDGMHDYGVDYNIESIPGQKTSVSLKFTNLKKRDLTV